jgi:uncharacterized membrane protein
MDEATKLQFKWKFYRLAIQLNIVVLMVAAAFMVLFKAPEGLAVPGFLAIFMAAAAMGLYFRHNYHATKAWLDEHA